MCLHFSEPDDPQDWSANGKNLWDSVTRSLYSLTSTDREQARRLGGGVGKKESLFRANAVNEEEEEESCLQPAMTGEEASDRPAEGQSVHIRHLLPFLLAASPLALLPSRSLEKP